MVSPANIGLQRTAPCGLAAEAGSFGGGTARLAPALLAIVTLTLAGCRPVRDYPDRMTDIRHVIEVLVADLLTKTGGSPGYVVLVSESRSLCTSPNSSAPSDCPCDFEIGRISDHRILPQVPRSLRATLVEINQHRDRLPALRSAAVVTAPSGTIESVLHSPGGWKAFYDRYPRSRGVVEISTPAFSPDRHYALTYIENSCGGTCGTGILVYLVCNKGQWLIQAQQMLWIS